MIVRTLLLAGAATALVAAPAAAQGRGNSNAQANASSNERVTICHLTGRTTTLTSAAGQRIQVRSGNIITISSNAVDAHVSNHGDIVLGADARAAFRGQRDCFKAVNGGGLLDGGGKPVQGDDGQTGGGDGEAEVELKVGLQISVNGQIVGQITEIRADSVVIRLRIDGQTMLKLVAKARLQVQANVVVTDLTLEELKNLPNADGSVSADLRVGLNLVVNGQVVGQITEVRADSVVVRVRIDGQTMLKVIAKARLQVQADAAVTNLSLSELRNLPSA